VGAVVLPGLVMLVLVLMPLLGRWKLGHGFNVGFTFALLIGAIGLTGLALREDRGNADYAKAVRDARAAGARAVELAQRQGIPPAGAVTLLRSDPRTQGPALFAQHCASCHNHAGGLADDLIAEEPSAPNLFGFGTQAWILGLLDPAKIDGPEYFGGTLHKEGDMSTFVHGELAELGKQRTEAVGYALAVEAGHVAADRDGAKLDQAKLDEGRALLNDADTGCAVCHKFHESGELGSAPDLTGYGTQAWLEQFIANPEGERFYPSTNDRMPAFGETRLTQTEINLLARWLRGEE
jgi:ubiquinol-cytochrome c reductase cytochrome b subunit